MLHIVMQMVLYRKNLWKVNRKFLFFRKRGKLVTRHPARHKIWARHAEECDVRLDGRLKNRQLRRGEGE